MGKVAHRKYTNEFKDGAVKLVTDHGHKIAETAGNFDIHTTQFRRWINGTLPDSSPAPASMA